VAVAALSSGKSMSELVAEYGVHPTMISTWKNELAAQAASVFGQQQRREADVQKTIDDLHRGIGQLTVERDFLIIVIAIIHSLPLGCTDSLSMLL
jgi:transposase